MDLGRTPFRITSLPFLPELGLQLPREESRRRLRELGRALREQHDALRRDRRVVIPMLPIVGLEHVPDDANDISDRLVIDLDPAIAARLMFRTSAFVTSTPSA